MHGLPTSWWGCCHTPSGKVDWWYKALYTQETRRGTVSEAQAWRNRGQDQPRHVPCQLCRALSVAISHVHAYANHSEPSLPTRRRRHRVGRRCARLSNCCAVRHCRGAALRMAQPIKTLFVTLRRSFAGTRESHRAVIRSLGLSYREQTVEVPNRESIRGAIDKVGHNADYHSLLHFSNAKKHAPHVNQLP